MGLWVVAGAWASDQLTEGFVPEWFVQGWPKGKMLAGKLVKAGLWDVDTDDGDKGWRFHDWLDYNPSAEEETARKKAHADKMKRLRRNKQGRYVSNDVPGHVPDHVPPHVRPPRPDPSRPDHSKDSGGDLTGDYGADTNPPSFALHCPRHQHIPEPGPCGDCADRRKSSIRLVQAQPCLVHAEPDVRNCRGCAADLKAAPGS